MVASPDPLLHRLPADEVVRRLGGDAERGLDPAGSGRRRERFGPNALPTRRSEPAGLRFPPRFHQPLVGILPLSAAVTPALAGESLPVQQTAAALPEETQVRDRGNPACSSSRVTCGRVAGIVVATAGPRR